MDDSHPTPPTEEQPKRHIPPSQQPGQKNAYRNRWTEEDRKRHNVANNRAQRIRLEAQKKADQRRAEQRAHYAENRDEILADRRRYRQEHAEAIEASRTRYRQNHPEKDRESRRQAAANYRDKNPTQTRERARIAAAELRERDPDVHKRWYQDNIEAERARGRERSRLHSRLKKLELPPPRHHRVYATEKRANTAAADEFFARRYNKLTVERMAEPSDGWRARRPSAALSDMATEERREEDALLVKLPYLLELHSARYGARIRSDVEMDNRARIRAGNEPYDTDHETSRRLLREVITREAPQLDLDHIVQRTTDSNYALPKPVQDELDAFAANPAADIPTSPPGHVEWVRPYLRLGNYVEGHYRTIPPSRNRFQPGNQHARSKDT